MNGSGENTREQPGRGSTVEDPATLERRSDTIRQDMGQTLDALQRNYSPGALVDRGIDLFKEHGGEAGANLGRSVRENPMPVLLTLLGVGWMMYSQSQKGSRQTGGSYETGVDSDAIGAGASYGTGAGYESYDATGTGYAADTGGSSGGSISDKLGSVRERVQGAKESALDTVRTTAQRAAEGSQRVAGRAREQSRRAKQGLQTMLQDQPLVVGALGIALGAVIGALIPESDREKRAFGESRERLLERAKELGQKGYEKARATAQQATEGVRGAADAGLGSLSTGAPGSSSLNSTTEGSGPATPGA